MKKLLIALAAVIISTLGAQAQVLLRGDVWYAIYGDRFRLEADAFSNYGDQTTERLRFRVWASEDRWETYERGRVIALGALPRLRAEQTRYDLHRTVRIHYPHTDWYYITVTVEERFFDELGKARWDIMDIVEFSGRRYLRDPDDWWRPFPF